MVEAVITHALRLSWLLAWFTLPSVVRAHQLDEYLQSTLVAIDPSAIRLQIILTPGVAIAEKILPLIDRDADGTISTHETTAYADLLSHDLTLQLDQQSLELKLTTSDIPTPTELRTGAGLIQLEFTTSPGALTAGPHTLTLQNHHLPSTSVYLINAAKPRTDTIQITRQKRNEKQSTGEIAFTFQPPANPSHSAGLISVFVGLLIAFFMGGWALLRHRRVHKT